MKTKVLIAGYILLLAYIAIPFGMVIHALNNRPAVEPIVVEFVEPESTIYQIAPYKTGCPEWILKGIRFAESSYGTNCAHPDPLDIGDYGLHETPEYHAERAGKYGEYNPYCPLQSAIIAGNIIMENYQRMGDMDKAISAYRRGVTGTNRNGIDWQYVNRVKLGGGLY